MITKTDYRGDKNKSGMTWSGNIKPTVRKRSKVDILSKEWPRGGGRGGGNSRKFYAGRLRPKVQPLTLIYILSKGRPQAGKELKKVFYGEDPPKVLPFTFIYTISDKKVYPFCIPY